MAPRVEKYGFGSVTIDGEEYSRDVVILPDGVLPDWRRRSGHRLVPEDLECVVKADVHMLVVGTGSFGAMRVPESTLSFLKSGGTETIVLKTDEACGVYNELKEKRRVAAALHLTC